MTCKIYLHIEDIDRITKFVEKFPDIEYITLEADTSSGIGQILTASIVTTVNGEFVTVTKNIVDETSW